MSKNRFITWLEKLADQKVVVALALGLIILASSWALLRPGLFFVHDTLHVARAVEMWQAIQDGQWPPRWSSNFGFGYGIPLFEFYAPLPSYMGALLVALDASPEVIFKVLLLIPNLVTVLGTYLLGKKWLGTWSGVLMAALVTLAPYRAVNLFVRGAFSESWGMMFFPLIILSAVLVLERKKWAWVGLVLSLMGLFLSHNLTTLLFVPFSLLFIAVYGLLKVKKRERWGSALRVAGAYLLAIGGAAYYVFPAFLEKNVVKIEAATDAYYHFSNHFVLWRQFLIPFWGYGGSQPLLGDGMSFFLGYGFWLGAVLTTIILGWQLIKNRFQISKLPNFTLWLLCVVLSGLALWLTTSRSNLIWESLKPLQFVQFPWRFLSVVSFFVGVSFTLAWSMVSHKWLKLGLGIGLVGAYLVGSVLYFKPDFWLERSEEFYFKEQERIVDELGPTLREYIPIPMPQDPTPRDHEVVTVNTIGPYAINVFRDSVPLKEVEIYSFQSAEIIWQTAAYPGWQVMVDGVMRQTTVDPETGLISLPLERGKHQLSLSWRNTLIRQVSDTISLVSLGILIAVVIWERLRPEKSYVR